MTYNQIIALFQSIATAHQQLKSFGNGEEWEVNGLLKPGIKYPILYVVPIDVSETENSRLWRFNLICFAIVKKDKSNENEVLSDCQSILSDIIKILKNESDDYDLINETIKFPFKEDYGDWCAGWRTEIVLETALNNNYCDVPVDYLIPPPPSIVVYNDSDEVVESISGLTYDYLSGPSNESDPFNIVGMGLFPDPGDITVVPSSNIEVYNGSTWQSSSFTVPYNGNLTTAFIYKVRLKAGLTIDDYSETITVMGGGAEAFVISVDGSVEPVLTIVATGGTVTRNGDFLVHAITGDDVFEVTNIGPVYNYVEYLGIGGSGPGASNGAGGAGGYKTAVNHVVSIGSYPITIGAGGPGTTLGPGTNGSDSIFDAITCLGGGYGGGFSFKQGGNGGSGGSNTQGGGATQGLGTPGQGNDGGFSNYAVGSSAGGGGAGAAAIANNNDNPGTPGGAGLSSSITGSAVFRAGGGGGAGVTTGGVGGNGGGGHGGGSSTAVTSGAVNKGSGGGGSHDNGIAGGNGGSGVFYISYYSPL